MKKTVESVWLVYKGRRFLGFLLASTARRIAQTPEEPHLQDQAGLGFTIPKNVWYNMILRKTEYIQRLQDLKSTFKLARVERWWRRRRYFSS
jgi:hypothetical protein